VSLRDLLVQTINEELMPRFRTKVEELLPKIPEKASGEQIAAMLRNNGVTADEIRWTKLDRVLKQPKVTKAEIVAHLKQHGLPFQATDHVSTYGKRYDQYALKGGRNYGEKLFHTKRTETKLRDEEDLEWVDTMPDAYGVTFQCYGYRPGADRSGRFNPPDDPWADVYAVEHDSGRMSVVGRVKDDETHRYRSVFDENYETKGERDRLLEQAKAACTKEWINGHALEAEDGNNYHSSHWPGQNQLFHVRHQEFTDADGKEIWLIEEIQSDWHQAGRKKGYSDGKKKFQILHNNNPLPVNLDSGNEFSSKEEAEKYVKDSVPPRMHDKITYRSYGPGGIPDAPMKKSWEEMAFKWALHQAVEANADRIGWVTGQISADRYDLSKNVGEMMYNEKQGWVLRAYKPPNADARHIEGANGGLAFERAGVKPDELEGLIGKEMAKKILAQPEDKDGRKWLRGLELKLGGEGMKAAYDQRIPSIAKKIAKATGAMMGKVMIPDAESEAEEADPYDGDVDIRYGPEDNPVFNYPEEYLDETPKEHQVDQSELGWWVTFEGEPVEGGRKFNTRAEAEAAMHRLMTITPGKKGHEVWYLELNNKVRDLVAGGMRATFESEKPKSQPWWVITEGVLPKFRTKVTDLLPKLPNKASGQQIAAMLKNNGVTADEIKWTKLGDLLSKAMVTKAEIEDHLNTHGNPFNVHDQSDTPTGSRYTDYALRGGQDYGEKLFLLKPHRKKIGDPTIRWQKESYKSGATVKYPEGKMITYYNGFMNESPDTIPAGESVRDSLDAAFTFTAGDDGKVSEWTDNINIKDYPLSPPETPEEVKAIIEKHAIKRYPVEDMGNDYKSGHWPEATNPLFHVRHQEFRDADGKNLWLIEEIQSDWHQQGRKKGYKGDKLDTTGWTATDTGKKPNDGPLTIWEVKDANGAVHGNVYAWSEKDALENYSKDAERNADFKVPDAPMRKTWEEMAFKWSLHHAVEAGADRIGWVTGDISADRYDLSKQIDSLTVTNAVGPNPDANYWVNAKKDDEEVFDKVVPKAELDTVIGKDMAKKVEADLAAGKPAKYSGLALKVGGEGMKAAYDQRIPSIAKKIAKQTGAQVGKIKILSSKSNGIRPSGISEPITQHQLDNLRKVLDRASRESWGEFSEPEPTFSGTSDDEEDPNEGPMREHEARKKKWEDAESEWQDCYAAALKALPKTVAEIGNLSKVGEHLTKASSIESEWGDDPSSVWVLGEILDALEWNIPKSDTSDAFRTYHKMTFGANGHEVWYMDLNDKVRELVKAGLRATFEAERPRTTKPWWVI
jgi:hypothetical protein